MGSVMQGERNWRFFVKGNILSTTHRNCQADKAWLMARSFGRLCVCVCKRTFFFLHFLKWKCCGSGRRCCENVSFPDIPKSENNRFLSAYSSQCIVCRQWANISALCACVCVCRQQAVVPMVVCYWLVISVGNRSCYQAWHGDRRGWMMHGTGKLFRRKDNGATHARRCIHTHAAKMNGYTLAHASTDSCTHNRPITQLSANVLAAIDLFSAPRTAH